MKDLSVNRWYELSNRSRDALVAETVLGWRWIEIVEGLKLFIPPAGDQRLNWTAVWNNGIPQWLPHYSTDATAQREITDKIIRHSHTFDMKTDSEGRLCFRFGDDEFISGDNESDVICLAAITYCQKHLNKKEN